MAQLTKGRRLVLEPLQDYVIVRLIEPQAPQSPLIALTAPSGRGREARVERVGPRVIDLEPGARVCVNSDLGVQVGDELLLPFGGILALLG